MAATWSPKLLDIAKPGMSLSFNQTLAGPIDLPFWSIIQGVQYLTKFLPYHLGWGYVSFPPLIQVYDRLSAPSITKCGLLGSTL